MESELQRLLAVGKVIESEHNNELLVLHIDGDGIRLGKMLCGNEGLLGGRPTRRQALRGPPADDGDD